MLGECHAHIFMDAMNLKTATARHADKVDESVIHKHFEEYAKREITFIRDGGDALGVSERAKDLAGDYGIDYRTPIFAIHKNGYYGGIVGKGFDTIEEYKALVLEAKERGADFIKIMTTGIMDFDQTGVITGTDLTEEDVTAMIAIAHEEHLAVMAHTNGASAVKIAVKAGVDSIEHGNYLDEEAMRMMAKQSVIFVPTCTVVPNQMGHGLFHEDSLRRIWDISRENIRKAFDLGVCLAAGSDAGAHLVYHGEGLLDEVKRLRSIIPEEEALMQRLTESESRIRQKFCAGSI
ncbi:MAG: amidohydrolase family protein [Lachnospiraceae bacterium]|jgi:hypothetical protein